MLMRKWKKTAEGKDFKDVGGFWCAVLAAEEKRHGKIALRNTTEVRPPRTWQRVHCGFELESKINVVLKLFGAEDQGSRRSIIREV